MKRMVKAFWSLIGPIRRPIQARVESFLADALARALERQNPARVVADEVNLVLDTVIAEQFRLREQIEEIRRLLDAHASPPVIDPPHLEA